MVDALIVGAGPAGCSCALWLKQLGFEPVLIDRNTQCGGLQLQNPYTNTWIATSADAYGPDVARAMHANMERHGISMNLGVEAQKAIVGDDGVSLEFAGGTLRGRYLVLATGVGFKSGGFTERLGLIVGPGPRVASTDFAGASVAILGGGDSAFENYGFVRGRGASRVRIFARTLRARAEMFERADAKDVVIGEFAFDERTSLVNGEHFDHVLVMYGYQANKASLLGLEPAMRPDGFVATDDRCFTTVPRVLAIGEIARRAHPCCVTSMADGIVAAKALQNELESSKRAQFVGGLLRGVGMVRKTMLGGSSK